MTVLVGVRCRDGIVIGADSAVTYSPISDPHFYTAEAATARKVHVVHGQIVVATTGEVGLGQRLIEMLSQALANDASRNAFLNAAAVDAGTWISENATVQFKRTLPAWARSYDLGALIGVVIRGEPHLYWFDHVNFRPELVGERDEQGRFRTPPVVSAGGGQRLADPFLLHAHRILFGDDHFPSIAEGRLLVAWTLDHAIRYNTGGVGGPQCIVNLAHHQAAGDEWCASEVDQGEMQQAVKDIERHIGQYGKRPAPEVVPDINAALAPDPQQQ